MKRKMRTRRSGQVGHILTFALIAPTLMRRVVRAITLIVDPGSAVPRKSNHVSESREAGDLNVTNDDDVVGQIGSQIPSELVGNPYAVLFASDND